MKEAVIVSTARTGLTKSHRGSFNNLEVPSMVAPVIQAIIERAGIEPGEVEDVIMGAANQHGVLHLWTTPTWEQIEAAETARH